MVAVKAIAEAVTAAAPPEIAYATALDLARWPDFIRGISKLEIVTPGEPEVGTRFRETRTMFGREAVEEMTIAELDPPNRQVFTAQNHGARYTATTQFIADGSGTRIRLTFEGVPVTFLARLLSPLALLMAGSVRTQIQNDLNDMAAEADRRAGRNS